MMPPHAPTPKFGDALQRLEEIVRLLEQPLALETALNLFEEGHRLAETCQAHLQAAQFRIDQLQVGPSDLKPL